MAALSDQPRGIVSTLLMSLVFGLGIGLMWIGRVRVGLLLFILELVLGVTIYMFPLEGGLSPIMLDPILVDILGTIAIRLIAIAVPLFLRARSRPQRFSSFWFLVLLFFFSGFLLAMIIRSLLYQPFSIPSGAMMPTLLEGDYLFVDKRAYGYSRYSFPYAAIPFEGRVFAAEPNRGDIVVFRYPLDPQIDYIMRVVGLPGDTVQMFDGRLFLNGEPVAAKTEGSLPYRGKDFEIKRETLPAGRSYLILDTGEFPSADNTRLFEVPEGHYFMLGDNRDNSNDSRFAVGFVPFENLVGKAVRVFWNANGDLDPTRQDLTRN